MISNEELEQRLKETISAAYVKVEGDGYHYNLIIVSDEFIGKSLVARQQWVYKQVNQEIISGSLHALTMKTWTVQEWETKRG